MALAQTDKDELKRFTFFVSRRFEEGRERFRLHMGYFTTLAEAEEWLSVVREIYPGAWAGEAPGKKLRARAVAAAAAQAQHALGPQTNSALPNLPTAPPVPASRAAVAPAARAPTPPTAARPAPAPAQAAPPVARPVEVKPTAARPQAVAPAAASFDPPGITVPTVHAAVPAAAAPPRAAPPVLAPPVAKPAAVQPPAPVAKAAPPQLVPPVAKPAPAVPAARAPGVSVQPAAAARPATISAPVAGAKGMPQGPAASALTRLPAKGSNAPVASSSKQRPKASSKGTAFADSNVREVLAALDDTGETGQTRMMPAPQMPRVEAQEGGGGLSDTAVLRYLETRRGESGGGTDDSPDASISLLKPDDTGTRRALKEAINQNAPVSFAVQLQWAVQPVELDKVPPLAIFSAYTLYTVEGSREGRKWYGLRLGFFSDAISAKQVAYYVRSEFASVAVVPVSPQEKIRATEEDNNKKTSTALAVPRKTRQGPVDEFKLIDSDGDSKGGAPAAAAKSAPAATPARPIAPPANDKRPGKGGGGRVNARERKRPQTLEETLEILGAGELEIDQPRGTSLNEAGVRHLRVEVQKNTPFSRLLERLSERSKKN